MSRRIGIFAGTFNPVHNGHRAFAVAAAKICRLEEIVFLPEPEPRQKRNVTSMDIRVKQLNEALADYPYLRVSVLNDKNFSVSNTLPKLRQLFPDADITLLVGSDIALQLKDWRGIGQLLKTCDLAIGLRSQHQDSSVDSAMESLQADVGFSIQYELIKTSHAHIASSQLK
jgi:nicotinate-nucleotide adenylyltransferase